MLLSESCDVLYVSELNCAFVKYKRHSENDDYRKPLIHAVDIIKAHDNCHLIFDVRDCFSPSDDDAAWLHGELTLSAYEAGCRSIFIIKNPHSQNDSLENHTVMFRRYFSVHECGGFDDIKLILLSRI